MWDNVLWWQLPGRAHVCHAQEHAQLGYQSTVMQCNLFDPLVLLILGHSCEVWAANPTMGEAAEAFAQQLSQNTFWQLA